MFPRIDYLHWIEGRPDAVAHDLGSSDLGGRAGDGIDDLLAAVTSLETLETDLEARIAIRYGVDRENVLVTAGACMANALAVGTVLTENHDGPEGVVATGVGGLGSDDEDADPVRVLVEKPGFEPMVETPRALGATVDRFLRKPDDYELDPDRIAAAVRDGTALVSVTNRHNPSGRLHDRDRLAAAVSTATDADAHLLVDEVYAPYLTEAGDGPFGGPTAAGLPGAVVTGSLTKFHGLDGLRIGWLVADEEFVERARTVAAHFPVTADANRVLARAALDRESIDAEARNLVARNADRLRSFVAARDDLAGRVFDGSTYAFLAHERADGDAVTEAAADRDLLVVPGRFFDDDERFRVSLGRDPDRMAAALAVLGETLDAL